MSFIETGSSVWITLFSKVDRKGNAYLINPNSEIHLKDIKYATGNGSWKDKMESLYFESHVIAKLGGEIDRNVKKSYYPKIRTGDDDGTKMDLSSDLSLK